MTPPTTSAAVEADVLGAGPGARVDRRELIPSEREEALGVERIAYDVRPVDDGPGERVSARQRAKAAATALDPRAIEGPLIPLGVFGLSMFVREVDRDLFALLLPEIRASFGVDLAFLVGISTAFLVAGIFIAPLMGFVADRVKRVWLVRVATVAGSAIAFFTATITTIPQLIWTRVAGGLAGSPAGPAELPLLTDYYPATSRARVFSLYSLMGKIGALVAPVMAGYLGTRYGWRPALAVVGGFGALAAVGTFLLREPKRGYYDRIAMGASEATAQQEQRPVSFSEGLRSVLAIKTVRRLMYVFPFVHLASEGLRTLMVVYYANVFHLSPLQRGYVLTAGQVMGLLGLLAAGPFGDRILRFKPGRLMTILGLVVLAQAVNVLVLAIVPNLWLSVVISMPLSFIGAVLSPSLLTLASLVVPARVRAFGIQAIAWPQVFGFMLFPFLFKMADSRGFPGGLLFFVPFMVIGAVILYSSGFSVERDIRAARATSMADEESQRARAAGRNKMLVCRDVDVEYSGVRVLFHVDFDVDEGEIVALVGTNGAGKSTLLRAIAGVQEASNGAIFLDGADITHAPPHQNAASGVVMMPGGHAVFPGLTVEENLRTAAWMYRAEADHIEARLAEVLDFFPVLRERLHEEAGNLSGGEQQMVGLGQAFLMRPRLLMIDELSLGLAPAVIAQLLDILRAIHAQGTTVLLVEQSLNVALTIAERAVFMEKGEVRFDGPTEELLRHPELVRSVFMGGASAGAVGSARRRRTSGAPAEIRLQVEEIGVRFGGVQALHGVSLDIAAAEIVGIIGPNGAGKTTLFDVMSGFVRPDEGAILLGGLDATRLTPDGRARLGLARSFQNARLFPALTVRENVAVAFERKVVKSPVLGALWAPKVRRSEARAARHVDDLLELLGLEGFADKFVRELSTGTRRAVDVACIMAADPKVLLLDEPSSGLAQAETEELGPVLTRVVRETGCGMLVIEHDLPLITSISDRLVAMETGGIIAVGRPEDVVLDDRVVGSYLQASDATIARSDTAAGAMAAVLQSRTDTPEQTDSRGRPAPGARKAR